jgi:hypothetical protein
LASLAAQHRHRLDFDGRRFSGPAWDLMVAEARAAQFFLLGEEHGIAENPKLAGALFETLVPAGYRHLGIEISPPMATLMDQAARGGVAGLAGFMRPAGSTPAFYSMREEAEMLARVRAAAPGPSPVFWGMDYEVGADRRMLTLLEAAPKSPAAVRALAALRTASAASWARFDETHNPQFMYSFVGDPALVRAVRAAWPKPDPRSAWVLDTLEETFEINGLWVARKGWESNKRRVDFMRANFRRHWRAATAAGSAPKVMFKMGANHLIRGLTSVDVFDLGTLIQEVAFMGGGHAFNMMVIPGRDARVAVFDPSKFTYATGGPKDGYQEGLELLTDQPLAEGMTLFDLRPLRPLAQGRRMAVAYPELVKTVMGFDTLLVMSGSTPSQNL